MLILYYQLAHSYFLYALFRYVPREFKIGRDVKNLEGFHFVQSRTDALLRLRAARAGDGSYLLWVSTVLVCGCLLWVSTVLVCGCLLWVSTVLVCGCGFRRDHGLTWRGLAWLGVA
jgi:hypothetical protein